MKLTKLTIEATVTCGSTVTIDGKRYRITAVGVRGRGDHMNSPIECYVESDGKELFSVIKQRRRR